MLDYKEELKRLCAMTPTELWLLYPNRNKFTEKVVVEFEKADTEPLLVYTELINYLQIPVRKPWIVTFLCKNILAALAPKGSDFDIDKVGATPCIECNEQQELVIGKPIPTLEFDKNEGDLVSRQEEDINSTSDDVLLEIH